jgi:hypothetical protein
VIKVIKTIFSYCSGGPFKKIKILHFYLFFLPNVSVAGVGERLPKASIADHFRWKG